jgi:hypothetical protein
VAANHDRYSEDHDDRSQDCLHQTNDVGCAHKPVYLPHPTTRRRTFHNPTLNQLLKGHPALVDGRTCNPLPPL